MSARHLPPAPDQGRVCCARCRFWVEWSSRKEDTEAMSCGGRCGHYFCDSCLTETEANLGICRDCMPAEVERLRDEARALREKLAYYAVTLREVRDIDPHGALGEVTVFSALAGLSIAQAKACMALIRLGGA